MRNRFNFFDTILRSSSDGGAAGTAPAGADGAAADGVAAVEGAGASSSGAAPAGADGSGSSSAPSSPSLYRPEGLADSFLGKSDTETIDNLSKALSGYRDRDAKMQIPETAEAYTNFGADVPADIAPHLDTLKADPIYARMANFALENKIPLPQYQGLVKQFLSVGHEMGMLEPPVDDKAEKEALVPDNAKHLTAAEQTVARNRRMDENYAFIDAQVRADGGIDRDTADYVKAMLGDTARGHRFIEYVKGLAGGGESKVFMGTGGAAASDPKAELQRRQELPENTWGHPKFNQASYDALQADFRKVHGE